MPVNPESYIAAKKRSTNIQNVDVGVSPSGYGDMYDQLFSANPYRGLTYNKTRLQDFLSNLGFRTKYDDFVEQAKINAAEYDAGIFSLMQQNQYNSETAKVERMRAAGENPDLLGTSGVSDAASPQQDPNGMNVGESPEISPMDMFSFVSQNVLNIIPSTLSFASNLAQLRGVLTDNDNKELAFNNQVLDYATKFFVDTITEQDYKDAFEKNDWSNILDAAHKDADYLASTLFNSRGARKRFKLMYGQHSRSLAAKIQKYKSFDDFLAERESVLGHRSHSFFSDDDETMEGLMKAIIGPSERFQQKMNEINERYANKVADLNLPEDRATLEDMQNANQRIYESNIDAALQAQTENAANSAQKMQNEIFEATNQLFAEIMNELKGADNWWSKIAMALVGIARSQLLAGMHMQFGRNTQYQVNGDTGVTTEFGRSNFGISF